MFELIGYYFLKLVYPKAVEGANPDAVFGNGSNLFLIGFLVITVPLCIGVVVTTALH